MARSSIEWTESTWNPLTGCQKVSPGCKHCYAERMALRLQAMGQPNYRNGFHLTLHPQMLALPLSWKKPQIIFVNSMSDLFQDEVPEEYIQRVFAVMRRTHWHQFQVLTKRAERLAAVSPAIHIKFLSLEPLLGPLPELTLTGIDWVIVGGESGLGARPMQKEWVIAIREQCAMAGVPFFFKQWGGVNKKRTGRLLDGRHWDGMPQAFEALRTSGSQLALL